ncbi:TFIIB-type zinc ribbon-containing protein [Thiosulfatihalobacter marinus]|jgi:Zn-finger nucleic acid-binding protein|uniref:TFIIB-type zinc ribbon-containing protein n=1 Tax=Thiosulfatihalobacter marinus TaxID=2792481 RepID=UPI0018D9F3F8|nr:zf-TFIIB domain-containing protein [Thiosulfatihalobacter marinus]
MRCPVCDVALSMADRQGIEIDFCPECRGVWLDRGELDKIIERSIGEAAPPPPRTRDRRYDDDDREYRSGKHGGGHHGGYGKHGSRRKSWLHELFD